MRLIITLFISCLFLSSSLFGQEQTIYFDSNNYHLTDDQKASLIMFFSSEEEIKTNLIIEGFCDDVGSSESNQILSQKRADEVARFLQNELQLKIEKSLGKGEIPADENAPDLAEIRKKNRVVKIGFLIENVKIATDIQKKEPIKTIYKTFSDELQKGDRIIVKNLTFLGSLTLFEDPEEAEAELQKIVAYLNAHPTTKIEIQGHVCCISASFKDAYDRNSKKNNLSETRAKKIYDYLIEKGIAASRMTHKGYGRQFPISGGEEHENKRVEILIVEG